MLGGEGPGVSVDGGAEGEKSYEAGERVGKERWSSGELVRNLNGQRSSSRSASNEEYGGGSKGWSVGRSVIDSMQASGNDSIKVMGGSQRVADVDDDSRGAMGENAAVGIFGCDVA